MPITRRTLLAATSLGALAAGGFTLTAKAAATFYAKIVQEPGDYEARFPDILKLNDGRLMAVWHRATSHAGSIGTIQLSFGSTDGRTWSTPTPALANPDTMSGIDTRDPKIGKMNDGSVVMTFFTPAGKVYQSAWKPGWTRFTDPVEVVTSGITVKYSHGSPLALAASGTRTNEVLVPFYTTGTSGGAWFVRTRWDAPTNKLITIESPQRIIQNNNPVGRAYQEPSFVQFGNTIVCGVRAEQDGGGSPVIIAWWDAYVATPTYRYQSFTGVLANSHHLLKTSDGRVLFTYGDKAQARRPTVGMMISNPTQNWVKGTVVPIYDSGADDQANPSSVELSAGTYLTLGYNAKAKGTTDTASTSPSGGTLWVLRTTSADYA